MSYARSIDWKAIYEEHSEAASALGMAKVTLHQRRILFDDFSAEVREAIERHKIARANYDAVDQKIQNILARSVDK